MSLYFENFGSFVGSIQKS